MIFLFVENREKTAFWAAIGTALQARGHAVHWLVQNPVYAPKGAWAGVHILPFPTRDQLETAPEDAWAVRYPMLVTDRGRQYFNTGGGHYRAYQQAIAAVLTAVQPDLVLGEPTLFHELLTIDLCRKMDILFVHPAGTRYPQGRFSLFEGDTQVPLLYSGDTLPDVQARDLAERLREGRDIPFYMQRKGPGARMIQRVRWVVSRARVWSSRLAGERYNTPSLLCKARLARATQARKRQWEALARRPDAPQRTLLYPLQMQPEANLDVWGRPFCDQAALVQAVLDATPADVQVVVKANPKPKYELSAALLGLAAGNSRVVLLPLTMRMPQAHTLSLGALTVSGTVGFEGLFGRGRVISLRHPLIARQFPEFHADTPAQAAHILLHEPQRGRGDLATATRLIQALIAESFPGFVSDPFSHPACLDPANAAQIAAVIERCAVGRQAVADGLKRAS